MKLTLVTSNPQKAKEIGAALAPYDIELDHTAVDIDEIQADTVEAVIIDKIEQAFQVVQGPVIVDDAGMFFDGYDNFPGVYSRFMFASLGFDGLFKLITEGQAAHFASFIAMKRTADEEPVLFSGECHGTLTTSIQGVEKPKMPYDNFFIPNGDTRTFAQMSVAEKQQYDHRSKAVDKLIKYLQENN